jgi:hypothetical protein
MSDPSPLQSLRGGGCLAVLRIVVLPVRSDIDVSRPSSVRWCAGNARADK